MRDSRRATAFLVLAMLASATFACSAPVDDPSPPPPPGEGSSASAPTDPPATAPSVSTPTSPPSPTSSEPTCVDTTRTLCERACRCTSAGEAECVLSWGGVTTEAFASSAECEARQIVRSCVGARRIDHLACARALRSASCGGSSLPAKALSAPDACRDLVL